MWHVFGRICFPLRCCSSSILGKRPHPGDSAPEVSQALQHIARPRPAEDETCQPLQVKSDSDLDERSVIAKPRGEDADISGLIVRPGVAPHPPRAAVEDLRLSCNSRKEALGSGARLPFDVLDVESQGFVQSSGPRYDRLTNEDERALDCVVWLTRTGHMNG